MSTMTSSVLVENTSPTIQRQTDLLCRFLTALKGSRDIQTSHTTLHLFLYRRPANKLSNFTFQIANDKNLSFEYAVTCDDLLFRNQTNLSSLFLLAISPIIMIGRTKQLDIAMTKSESDSVLQYALANFNHIDILKIYTFPLKLPDASYDDRYIYKYVRDNGTTIGHVRDRSYISNEYFPDINILAVESDGLRNHAVYTKSKSFNNCFYDDSLEQEVPKYNFSLNLTEHKRLQELHIKVSNQEGLILFQFTNIKDPKKTLISFVTYQNTDGNLKRVKNDARLKPSENIPLKYVSVFYIITMSNIKNFNVWK